MVKLTRQASREATPVVILAGFLGAGKTTVLNNILRSAVGARVAVIVNDFGSANIDAMLITAETDGKLELTNGCICCSLDSGEFDEVVEVALTAKPDVIIIEASGLAEPDDLVRMVSLSLNKRVGYGGLVYVVDAVNYYQTIKRHRQVPRHIELADLVVVTKTEKVSGREPQRIELEISTATVAPVVVAKNGVVSPELLFDIPKRDKVQPSLLQQVESQPEHLHDNYQSVTFESSQPIDFTKFKDFMNNPLSGIYRIKGFVYFGMAGYEQKFVVQSVGGRWDMYADQWSKDEKPVTTLVIIGYGFDGTVTLEVLSKLIGSGSLMVDIERYTSR